MIHIPLRLTVRIRFFITCRTLVLCHTSRILTMTKRMARLPQGILWDMQRNKNHLRKDRMYVPMSPNLIPLLLSHEETLTLLIIRWMVVLNLERLTLTSSIIENLAISFHLYPRKSGHEVIGRSNRQENRESLKDLPHQAMKMSLNGWNRTTRWQLITCPFLLWIDN